MVHAFPAATLDAQRDAIAMFVGTDERAKLNTSVAQDLGSD